MSDTVSPIPGTDGAVAAKTAAQALFDPWHWGLRWAGNVRPSRFFSDLYARESRRFVLWLPVFLGIGIWFYFDLDLEPHWLWGAMVVIPALLLSTGLPRRAGWGVLASVWMLTMVSGGFGLAILSARMADAPVITYPTGETVEGRVLELSRSASGAPRMLLDRLVIYGIEPSDTPARVRLTWLDHADQVLPKPGERIRVYASLLPNGEPVEPGAFDFGRRAFFERLGGVGLTRGEVLVLPADTDGGLMDAAFIWLAGTRDRLSRALRAELPGATGAFAAAIIVGDRQDIEEADAEALRASNLAHLLAISGLHMGILTGLVFAIVRIGLALHPYPASHWPTKKIAAILALAAGAGYLALSGGTVATQRAFIMVGVAFCAILLDRPAITLRALALAATIVLVLRPISLLDAGFQMSFAATAALVAGFEAVRGREPILSRSKGGRGWILFRVVAVYVGALVFSSLLAGTATAPIAAYHFNRTAPYGLLANLLAVPVMGMWIAPWACIAALLAPFGLSGHALQAMGWGIDHVLSVAHWVASLPGAVHPVHAAPPIVLGLVCLGGLWLVLWQGRWRFAGIAGVLAGLVLWANAPARPDLLIAPDARLLGISTTEGRALDHARAQSFAAKTWLRRDGDAAGQEVAAARGQFDRIKGGLAADLKNGWRLEARWSKNVSPAELMQLCRDKVLLVVRHGPPIHGPCVYLGKRDLRINGAISITTTPDTLDVKASLHPGRRRLWDK